jgi:redox-sensitive bicupin YhaK (pirin superfamily)
VIKIVRSADHFRHEEDWLSTNWHFSFDSYRDPANMGFGPLRVFNDDIIQPGKGFGFHRHRDMEIITYVIDGELEHRDDRGNKGIISAGEVQMMTAGTGIMHSEYNHSKEKPLRLLQMWIYADRRGLEPSWEQQSFEKEQRADRLLPVIAPDGAATMRIHQDAAIYVSSLGAGRTVRHELGLGRKAYLFAVDGAVKVNGEALETRDAARIEGERELAITADKPTELLLIDLPGEYNVNNN